ncbi:hypothetical protein H4R18_003814 [Coemansia javaensis]|uniref:Uncharacterized protein n=1 Tax=Coemansia javaensis TaxID=2761396 RepID=A0A9W8HAV5_9FUNG|nr:hypothetical protein H4R18_003814 [Coemansia javaensis]
MGASNSKQEPVHVYSGTVPLGFTPQLKDKLEKEAKEAKAAPAATPDAVEAEVARELARILEKSQLEELKARERQTSTAELLAEIRDVAQQIGTSGPARESQSFRAALLARDRAAACLLDHKDRALDCWQEVAAFKSLVAALERETISAPS